MAINPVFTNGKLELIWEGDKKPNAPITGASSSSKDPHMPKFPVRQMTFQIVDDVLDSGLDLPILQIQINPQNFNKKFTKIIHRYKTFSAIVEEHWGEELDTISCNASTGAFLLEDDDKAPTGWNGLTTFHRTHTKAYQRYKELTEIYRNNGAIYNTRSGKVIRMGYIIISFDEGIYQGYFENFVVHDTAESPFRFMVDFIFKVENTMVGG